MNDSLWRVKVGLAEMLKGGVIMDVTTAAQAKIAEDAGACAVMALERVPSDIRKEGGVARMCSIQVIEGIQRVVSIPVMAKVRIGHFVEARVLEALGVDEIVCSPLNVGGGTIECAHGTFPVPAPAVVEMLKGAPVYSSGIQAELVTPTGAAIVKTVAARFAAFPEMNIDSSGYGAGTRDFPGHANVVRLVIGESTASSLAAKTATETVTVLEANLDDMSPQVFGYVMDRLLEEGALDAFAMPVQMKKNRPGTLLTVLCKPEDAGRLTQLLFCETTTLGVRRREESRQTLARRWENVRTQWGEVRIKIASMNGTVTNYAPEYEDCRRIAAEHRVPLKTVMQEATRAYLKEEHSS